jgi:ferredoxin
MLVINPSECIDCGVCEPECPAEAIKPESKSLVDWMNINHKYSNLWPKITKKKEPLPKADEMNGLANKLDKFPLNES